MQAPSIAIDDYLQAHGASVHSNGSEDLGDKGASIGGDEGWDTCTGSDKDWDASTSSNYDDDGPGVGYAHIAPPPPNHAPKWKGWTKERDASRRRDKRAQRRADKGTGQKHVSQVRGAQATIECFKLDADVMSSNHISRPGWIGRPMQDLPREEFTREVLEAEHHMKYYAWDGRWVAFSPSYVILAEKVAQEDPPATGQAV